MNNKYIIYVLEKSVEKNGEIPLTNQHLLNIIKLADEIEQQEYDDAQYYDYDYYGDIF